MRPKRSPIRPPRRSRLPNASAYAVTIHWRWSLVNASAFWARRQRDVHDGRVEHDHQLGDRDDEKDQPASEVVGVVVFAHQQAPKWIGCVGFAKPSKQVDLVNPLSYDVHMLRLGSWIRPAGGSPVPVSAGAPGSRPRSQGEILRAERGVESLFGGSKRVGWDCSLVKFTIGEPSRSCHGEGHVRQSWFRIGCGGSLRGTGTCTRARSDHGTRETRLSSLVSKDRSYKPMAKASGAAAGVRWGRSSGDRRPAKGVGSEGP